MSSVHPPEDAWEYLRSVDEVPVGISSSDYVSADTNAVTAEVLNDGDVSRLVGSMEEVAAQDPDDNTEDTEATVLTTGQVMDALYLLWQFAGTDEELKMHRTQ